MISVSFPGGVAVDATYRGHTIHTDQPAPLGGDSAMSPYDLFFASMASCMGFYALRFCQERKINTSGLALELDPGTEHVRVRVTLPEGFPDKYRDAITRAIDHCAVKRALEHPPSFVLALMPVTTVMA
jgi:putative redox protein